jgi:hypothetical protein
LSKNRGQVVIQVQKDPVKNHQRKKWILDVETIHQILMYWLAEWGHQFGLSDLQCHRVAFVVADADIDRKKNRQCAQWRSQWIQFIDSEPTKSCNL